MKTFTSKNIYKVRCYVKGFKTSWVYVVAAPNRDTAIEAAKKQLKRFGLHVRRAYANTEIDGIIDTYEEPFYIN